LDKTKKKLQEATNTMDDAATRSRAIERKLRDVQELPAADTGAMLSELELASSSSE
jgi:DNA recombination protein RmuC